MYLVYKAVKSQKAERIPEFSLQKAAWKARVDIIVCAWFVLLYKAVPGSI